MEGPFGYCGARPAPSPTDKAIEAARTAGREKVGPEAPGVMAEAMAEIAEAGARAAIESLREAGVLIVRI